MFDKLLTYTPRSCCPESVTLTGDCAAALVAEHAGVGHCSTLAEVSALSRSAINLARISTVHS